MKIDFTTPSGITDPLPPEHPFYGPSNEFIQRHGLHIDEAETWVELWDTECWRQATRSIGFRKDNGLVVVRAHGPTYKKDPLDMDVLFKGYLPNEEALEAVLTYTNWEA